MRLFLWLICAVGCISLPISEAAPIHFQINSDKSSILLHWQMIGKQKYHARITQLVGHMVIDPKQDLENKLQVNMPISTLDAHNRLLTYALKSKQFFNQERYPNVTFTSTRIVDLGNNRYRVFGDLQIRDKRRSVMLYGVMNPSSRLTPQHGQVRLTGKITVSRQAFGMGQYPALVADPIEVEIFLQGQTQESP